jgi:hypothetical protein
MKKHCFTLFFTFFTLSLCLSQTTKDPVKQAEKPILIVAELKQGSTIKGKLIERRGDTLVIDADKLGLIKLPMSEIASINEAGKIPVNIVANEPRVTNKFSNRTLLSPTALDNGKGAGEYNNYYLFANQFSGGLSDNVRLGGMAILVPGGGIAAFVTAKFSARVVDNFHIAVGGLAGGTLSFNGNSDNTPISLAYGLATLGDKNKNLTIGLGGLRTDKQWQSKPVLLVSGQYRVGDNWSLTSEFYTFKEEDRNFGFGIIKGNRTTTLTFGAKYFTPKIAFNFGFFGLTPLLGDGTFIPLPVLSISAPLDKKLNKLK